MNETIKSGFRAVNLRVNYLYDKVVTDDRNPSFSWEMQSDARGEFQSAYRILVSSDKAFSDAAVVWDSGRIESGISNNVIYNGRPLSAKSEYFWKVCIWNKSGQDVWSSTAGFDTAVFSDSDWNGAKWITYGNSDTVW